MDPANPRQYLNRNFIILATNKRRVTLVQIIRAHAANNFISAHFTSAKSKATMSYNSTCCHHKCLVTM